mgnify:CR=1 FL=1
MTQVWEYIKIALMNIRSNKGRSILTMLGIIIGISSVIMIISIGNGVKSGINGELNSMAGGQIAVYSSNTAENGTEVVFTEEDMDAILEKVPNVKAVTPSWSFSGSATGRKGTFDAAATFGKAGLEYSSQDPIIKGRYFTDSDYYTANKVCVITESSAKTLFGNTNVIGMSFDYTLYGVTQEFTIVGIRKDNASKLFGMGGNGTVTMEAPISTISEGYGFYVDYTDLLIVSDGAENASQVAQDTVRLLENRHGVRGQNVISVQNFNDIMSVTVTYGTHSLQAAATGYSTWSRQLVVNSETANIIIDLTENAVSSGEESTESTDTVQGTTGDSTQSDSSESTTTDSTQTGITDSSQSSTQGSTQGSTQTNLGNSLITDEAESDSTNTATESYLKTLSGIMDTLTGE